MCSAIREQYARRCAAKPADWMTRASKAFRLFGCESAALCRTMEAIIGPWHGQPCGSTGCDGARRTVLAASTCAGNPLNTSHRAASNPSMALPSHVHDVGWLDERVHIRQTELTLRRRRVERGSKAHHAPFHTHPLLRLTLTSRAEAWSQGHTGPFDINARVAPPRQVQCLHAC